MTYPIGATGSATPAQTAAQTTATSTSAAQSTQSTGLGQTLDGGAFLKLLVAQLKYQDPSKPVDSSAFMAQTAQLQMVETMQKLVDQNASVISGQQSLSALALTGQKVTWTGTDGSTSTGVVSAVKLSGGAPTLLVGDREVPLAEVTRAEPGTA